ncbi:MAG: hypothetical protein Q7U28_08235 [Aquabacterium sp.]|nr:hypothetical protein [Aquabacterium sp.]
MQLELIIAALRTRCPSFATRVAGAAQFKLLPETASLQVPCAFVIPLDDSPERAQSMNSVRQTLTDSFSVVVAVSNVADEKGQGSAHSMDALRAELWAALLGWQPAARYDGITYEGGSLLSLDRARMWYQFEFGAVMEIEPGDGWQAQELAALPHFDGGTIRVDAIDPSDPNLVQTPAPDGRIELGAVFPKTGNLA